MEAWQQEFGTNRPRRLATINTSTMESVGVSGVTHRARAFVVVVVSHVGKRRMRLTRGKEKHREAGTVWGKWPRP